MKKNRLLLVPIIFLSVSLIALVISFSCNNNNPKTETTLVDTSIQRKETPPLGVHGMEGEQPSEPMARSGEALRGVPPRGVARFVLENKDTLIITTTKKAISYIQSDTTIKKYNPGGTPTNKPPTSNAGADKIITLPTNNTSLTGSGTDTDGTIATYAWTKVSGGAATIASPAAATTAISGLVQGAYTFRLTVKDNGGLTATDDVIVTVNPAATVNKPPVANAGADKVITLPTNSTTLVGSGTDPDGTIASHSWTKVSGGAATIKTVGAATTVVEGLVEGAYVFRLTVKDNGGSSASDDVNVTVNPAPTSSTSYLSLPLSGPLDLSGKSNVIVENKRFSNINGIAIKMYSGANNITIRNCFFDGATMELVELENATNITIENCLFARGWAGVYAVGSKNVKIINCQFVNMKIKYVNGKFAGRGVFVQMNSCDGGEVTNCRGENFDGESDPEDLVSCYGGSSNIVIKGNMFRGGPNGGPSTSGGGIIVGDTGGNNCLVENNTLLRPGQYGLAVAGGKFNKILNNKVWSDKTLVSNNPLYVANYSGAIGCSDITVSGNRVNWIDKSGNRNNGWNSGDCANTNYDPANNATISLEEMGVPAHLITFVTPAELLTIRK
ncbi:MAG: PKD domain-containing protein [Chitinophagaceae bacterium]